jgi:hypothetical protein
MDPRFSFDTHSLCILASSFHFLVFPCVRFGSRRMSCTLYILNITDSYRYCPGIYIHFLRLILMTTRSISDLPPLSGPWSFPQPAPMLLWKCRRSTVRVAISGDPHVLIIAVCVTTALRRKIIIASGSTTAWDAATTVTFSSSSVPPPC